MEFGAVDIDATGFGRSILAHTLRLRDGAEAIQK